jgi:flagellar protein FliL
MKLLVPLAITLVGLGAGVGAGFLLRPPPSEEHAAADCGAPGAEAHGADVPAAQEEGTAGEPGEDPCPETAEVDPFEPAHDGASDAGQGEDLAVYVPFEKPFVVPVFSGEKVVSMVVLSLSVAAHVETPETIRAMEPRLRDRLLEALFLHSNTGGFNGSFTTGRKIEDLKAALIRAAQDVLGPALVSEVLITEINRQDV